MSDNVRKSAVVSSSLIDKRILRMLDVGCQFQSRRTQIPRQTRYGLKEEGGKGGKGRGAEGADKISFTDTRDSIEEFLSLRGGQNAARFNSQGRTKYRQEGWT